MARSDVVNALLGEIADASFLPADQTGAGNPAIFVDKDDAASAESGTKDDPYKSITAAVSGASDTDKTIVFIKASSGGGPFAPYEESVTVDKSIVFVGIGDVWWAPVGGSNGFEHVVLRHTGVIDRLGLSNLRIYGNLTDLNEGINYGLYLAEVFVSGPAIYSQLNELIVIGNKFFAVTNMLAGTLQFTFLQFALNPVGVKQWVFHDNFFYQGSASIPSGISFADPDTPTLNSVPNGYGGQQNVYGNVLTDYQDNTFVQFQPFISAKFLASSVSGATLVASGFTEGTIASVLDKNTLYIRNGGASGLQAVINDVNITTSGITLDRDMAASGLSDGDQIFTGYKFGNFANNNMYISTGTGTISQFVLGGGGAFSPVSFMNNSFAIESNEIIALEDQISILEFGDPEFGVKTAAAKRNQISLGGVAIDSEVTGPYQINKNSYAGITQLADRNLVSFFDNDVHTSFTQGSPLAIDNEALRNIIANQVTISGFVDTLEAGQVTISGFTDTLEAGQVTISGFTDTLEAGQTTISGFVDTLETGQTTISGFVDTLEAGQTTIIADILAASGGIVAEIDANEAKLDTIILATDTLEAGQTTISGFVDTLEDGQTTISGFTDTLEAGQSTIIAATDTLEAGQTTISGFVDTLEAGQTTISGFTDTLEAGQTTIIAATDTLEAGQTTISGFVDTLEAGQTTISGFTDTLEAGQTTIIADILAASGGIVAEIDANEVKLDTIILATDTLEAGQTTISGFVDTLEAGQTTISGFVDTLEAGQATIIADIASASGAIVAEINANEVKIDTVIANQVTISGFVDQIEGFVDTLEAGQVTISGFTDTLEAGQVTISGFTDTLEAGQTTISGFTDTLEAGQTTISGFTDTLETGQTTIISDIAAMSGALVSEIDANEAKLDTIILATDTLESGQSTLISDVADVPSGVWTFTTRALTSVGNIADAVWDELLSDHVASGTTGSGLTLASQGVVDVNAIADAVWDEALSDHIAFDTTASGVAEAASGSVDITSIVDAVWDEALADHVASGSTGSGLTLASQGAVDEASIADAVWDELLSGHTVSGSAGKQLSDLALDHDVIDSFNTAISGFTDALEAGHSLISDDLVTISGLVDQLEGFTDTLESGQATIISGINVLAPFGDGSTVVDHNFGGTDNLRVTNSTGGGIDNVNITAFLKSNYDIGNTGVPFIVAQTRTAVDGRWEFPINLDPETYTLVFAKQGSFVTNTAEITVT